MGPPIRAVSVMAEIHSDLTGFQRTTPSHGIGVVGVEHARGAQ